jgi:hypothetical protein
MFIKNSHILVLCHFRWFYNVVGGSRCPISDTWWQTETGGFMVICFWLHLLNFAVDHKVIVSIYWIELTCIFLLDHPFAWRVASETRFCNISFLWCSGKQNLPVKCEEICSHWLLVLKCSLYDLQPVIVNEKGQEIEGECSGYLCIKKSWPGVFRTLYGDHERYETTYFKPFAGYYFTGDGCSR